MGAGCSSPLRRFGGKRGKPTRRESSPFEVNGDSDNHDQAATNRQEAAATNQTHQHRFIVENEITIQSETQDDHPSSASYYNQNDETTKISEHSGVNMEQPKGATAQGQVVARIMGLNGGYTSHLDRHLLVSPALSPAPSTCYSPSPASSIVGCSTSFDLNDLNEAFKTLTFGLQDQAKNRIKQPERQQSELHNQYTQQLVQSQQDLINYISVIFITTDNFQTSFTSASTLSSNSENNKQQQTSYLTKSQIDNLANYIESNLKSFCDEHSFNLKFLNLSHAHLSEQFHINNLLDASMRIFEHEYLNNCQRTIIIVLSNNSNNISNYGSSIEAAQATTTGGNNGGGSTGTATVTDSSISSSKRPQQTSQTILDKRQLPTKIEAQSMIKLQSADGLDDSVKDLLKLWYNQVGSMFHLNPIYLVYPKILSEFKEEREKAWQCWINESSILIKAISLLQETDNELASEIKLKSLFTSYIQFILNQSALQKRTLLIRNYSQPITSASNQQQSSSLNLNRFGCLNELARLLPDPNKLTLKRSMNDDEFTKTTNDWICENFNKFIESILDNQIIHGKHVPPFFERNLFTELTRQRHHLEHYLDSVSENFEAKCRSFHSSQIMPILNGLIDATTVNNTNTISSLDSTSTNTADNQQSPTPQPPSTNHLVFISGPKGCGKSTLFAQIIRFTAQELFNKAHIIYRFCGISLDSLSPNRLLRSICEQYCQTQGENIAAASYIYSARKEIMNALNKIVKLQTSVIFLDELDVYKLSSESDLDWLCEIEANSRIKIFIMLETDSDLYRKVLSTYSDATYISLDYPSINEWAQMLTCTARSKRFSSSGSLYDEIKNINLQPESKYEAFTYRDVSDIINMCRIRQFNNEIIYPELSAKLIQSNLKSIPQVVLLHLQYLLPPYQLGALFVVFNSCRNGLIESDLVNIMTMISQTPKATTNRNTDQRFSSALLNYIKIQLQPWLLYIICDKAVKIAIERTFLTRAIEHYASSLYPTIVSEVQETLLDYFNRQTRSKSSISSLIKGDNSSIAGEPRDHVSSAERLWLATQASELMYLLIQTNATKAKDHIMNKHQFYMQFLYGSMPEEFIEDCERLKDVSCKKEELQLLVNYIRQSIHPLRYDGSQIYSQIYCRALETMKGGKFSKSKKFNEILAIATCPPIRNLLPISETSVNSFIKARIGQPTSSVSSASLLNAPTASNNQKSATKSSTYSQQQAGGGPGSSQAQAKQRIYTIKDNHRHVIVIYPDKGSLAVWDIYEERAVRNINNLDQPRDIKMIDQKRAVILCNRELRVYDLDSGTMLMKLKGVMNQKMPFYEVFGENYVVALARNRMYVNMLNLNTGELETTFKVGEDRFLNSLLVSANGGICVCGDETQKPFPLLVWNLNERRLMYDLRLDRHEFITKMSAISDDGHFVVSVCRQLGDAEILPHGSSSNNNATGTALQKPSPNFIVIYDLSSGTLFKKWKPGLDSCSVAISLSANRSGKVINTIVNSSILVWDLATGSKRHTLIGHSAPADVIRVQNNRLFSMDSTCRDQSLRIWDIEEGHCLAVFSPDAPVNCCQISTRGDALVCGFAAETRLSTLVMCKNETVNDVVKRNKRRKSSKSLYIFDEPPSRKSSS